MIAGKKENGKITQYIEDCDEIPEGFVEVTENEIQDMKDKNELETIEKTLKTALPRYNELKELGEMRSVKEEQEYQAMANKKTELLTRRQTLLNA